MKMFHKVKEAIAPINEIYLNEIAEVTACLKYGERWSTKKKSLHLDSRWKKEISNRCFTYLFTYLKKKHENTRLYWDSEYLKYFFFFVFNIHNTRLKSYFLDGWWKKAKSISFIITICSQVIFSQITSFSERMVERTVF